MLIPVWTRGCYHLRGNYCSWNCAKADCITQTKTHAFPKDLTSLALFAFQISFRGRHCPSSQRTHSPSCLCYTRFTGLEAAPPKETLHAFGGDQSIKAFRSRALTIESYEWVTRFYSARELVPVTTKINPKYLYTMEPFRKCITLREEESDPIVLIKKRVF